MTTIPRACRLIGHPASQLTPPGAGQHGDLRIPEPSSSLIDGQCGVEEPLLLEQQPVVERAVGIAALLSAAIVFDGESIWLEGAALIGLYGIIAASFWWG